MIKGEIQNLALCGLLHDVGKTRIPIEILNKPSSLTDEEFALMRNHAVHGRTILMATGGSLQGAVDVAFSHHERVDGKGYPRGLPAQNIPYFAKIIALVDTYDAITSTRVYQKALASMHALEIIHKNRGTQFDAELADAFIRMVGIYPPGSIVEMLNGLSNCQRGARRDLRYCSAGLCEGRFDCNGAFVVVRGGLDYIVL